MSEGPPAAWRSYQIARVVLWVSVLCFAGLGLAASKLGSAAGQDTESLRAVFVPLRFLSWLAGLLAARRLVLFPCPRCHQRFLDWNAFFRNRACPHCKLPKWTT